jgi:hypothetical protein
LAVTYTANYNLSKPDGTERPSPTPFNGNSDLIDAALASIFAQSRYYGTCSTGAATTAKVVTCTGFALATGAEIEILFTYGNTASSPTVNVNSTGAKSVTGAWSDGQLVRVRYDGTSYVVVTATVSGLWTKIRDIADVTGSTQTVSISLSDISFSTYKKIKLVGFVSCTNTTSDTLALRVNTLSTGYTAQFIDCGDSNVTYASSTTDMMVASFFGTNLVKSLVDIEITLINNVIRATFDILGGPSIYGPYRGSARVGASSLTSFDIVDATTGKYPVISGFSVWGMK